MKLTLLAGSLAGAALLSGCASPLANKPADQVFAEVMEQNARDARYNFDGELRFTELTLKPTSDTPPSKRDQAIERGAREVLRSLRFEFAGAVDVPARVIEVTPRLRFSRRNLEAWVSVPMYLDGKNFSLLVDPGAIDLVIDSLGGDNQGKLVRFKLPAEYADKIPLDGILNGLPPIVHDGYASVDKQAYQFLELNDADRQQGGRYKVQLALDNRQQAKLAAFMLERISKLVEQELAKRRPAQADAAAPNDSAAAGAALTSASAGDPTLMLGMMGELLKQEADAPATLQTADVLLDRKGRVLAIHQQLKADDKRFAAAAVLNLRMSHHGQPQFRLSPDQVQVIDYQEVGLPSWLQDEAQPEAVADDAASADAATPAVVRKSSPRKPRQRARR